MNYRARNIRMHSSDKYYISKQAYLTAMHFAYQYRDWLVEYNSLVGIKAGAGDGMPRGNSTGDPTETTAERLASLSGKIKLIEETVHETDPDLAPWLLQSVTIEDLTIEGLFRRQNVPCSRRTFSRRRSKFYFLLSHALEKRF